MFKMIGTTLLLAIIGTSLIFSPLQAKHSNQVYYKDQVAVLMYHHIHDQDQSSSTITTELFQKQLQELRAKSYHFISLSEFKQFMDGAAVPDNAILVTFDDGYQSFYTHAYPILANMQIPAVNFIITETLANPLASYIPYVSNEQITAMTHSPNHMDTQCHTDSLHTKLPSGKAALIGRLDLNGTQETDEQYKHRILQDTTSCRDKLSKLGDKPVDSYAYPYGIWNKQASELIHEAGIRYAFTISPQMATRSADRLQIPRINAGSPNITPELLHRTIQRRVVALPDGFRFTLSP
jgi:peptidoglycan/xylan/chitin deacetylase (PgdA/CDA1 family)